VPSISMTPSFFAISSVYPLHVSDRLRRMPPGIMHRRMSDADTPKELLYGIDAARR